MPESLDRPTSLPKLRQNSRLVEYKNAYVKNRRKSSRLTRREVIIPHLDKAACEKLINDKFEVAFQGNYEERAEFLNQFHRLIVETEQESLNSPEFFEKICLKILLFLKDEYPAIRAMCFRILRLCLFTERNLTFMITNHVDIYVVRSLDLCVDNEIERCEALRLIGAMINVYETSFLKKLIEDSISQNNGKKYAFPKSIMQPVIAIALKAINKPRGSDSESTDSDEDRLGQSCLSMFLEFCIHEPRLIIDMSGTDWIVRILTGNSGVNKGVANLVCRVLVIWLDDPAVRNMAQLHLVLEQIFAPLIEFGFFEKNVSSERVDKMVESVMVTFSHSFIGILRSWSGLFACAAVGPNSNVIASSPLRLLEYLGLGTVGNVNLSHIRDMIVNICCDFMEAPYAQKTFESWKEAVSFYGSLTVPDVFSSSLKEDFVLAQTDIFIGNDPEFVRYVDVLYSFRYLAFFVLINAGLPQSLARLIVANPNAPSAIKATLLLSDFLRIAPSVVPSTWRASILSMPSLFQSAAESVVGSKAAAAVNGVLGIDFQETFSFINTENATIALHRFDNLNRVWIHNMTSEPAPDSNYSLFMDHRPLTPASAEKKPWRTEEHFSTSIKNCWKNDDILPHNCLIMFTEALREISFCQKSENINQVIEIIAKILHDASPSRGLQTNWVDERRLVVAAKKAIHLAMRLTVKMAELEEILVKFVSDLKECLNSEFFSVKNLIYNGSMYHIALIGTLSSHKIGNQILERFGLYQLFIDKMSESSSAEFVKAVVSSLNYEESEGRETLSRTVLQKALTSANEMARRWCTRFLGAVAAQRFPDFHEWGVRLLLGQLGDKSNKVVRQTIRMLHQWLPVYPESVRFLRAVPLDSFGEAGQLLKAYLYMSEGFCQSNHDAVLDAIHMWMTGFNTRYFESLDEDMRVALLDVKRSLTGGFSRASNDRHRFGVRAPAHLFGSLAHHEHGRYVLEEERVVRQLLVQLSEEKDMALVKGAVMALGQIGSAAQGPTLFSSDVIPKIMRLAEEASTLSVRGAAFWALNMIATSVLGAEMLCEYGWESNQHRWVVDKTRRRYEKHETEEERRPTLSTPIVPEVSISFEKPLPPRRLDSPMGRYNRARSSSDGCWSPAKVIHEAPTAKLRRSGSDFAFQYPLNESPSMSEYDSDNVRSRAMTSESGILCTSAFSSSIVDDSIGFSRRRTTTTTSQCDDVESRSRSSTVAHCLSQGLMLDKSRLEAEGTAADLLRDPHFSTKNREKWRLAPFKTRRFLQVNRNIGDPVRYIFMTRGEEECVSEYRNQLLHDSWLSRHLKSTVEKQAVAQAVYIVALPSEVQVMCGNIFHPKKLFEETNVNDRGAKGGYSKNQRTDAGLLHSSYRCFYCEANVEKYPLPTHLDVANLRKQVLYEVDMLEVKESTPEKKLINLRAQHPWLFEWPCLYADVLELLDEYRFKPRSRSFLQEIFYDALKFIFIAQNNRNDKSQ